MPEITVEEAIDAATGKRIPGMYYVWVDGEPYDGPMTEKEANLLKVALDEVEEIKAKQRKPILKKKPSAPSSSGSPSP